MHIAGASIGAAWLRNPKDEYGFFKDAAVAAYSVVTTWLVPVAPISNALPSQAGLPGHGASRGPVMMKYASIANNARQTAAEANIVSLQCKDVRAWQQMDLPA